MKGGFELHVPGVAMSLKDDVVASIVDLRLGHLQVATIESVERYFRTVQERFWPSHCAIGRRSAASRPASSLRPTLVLQLGADQRNRPGIPAGLTPPS